MIHHSGAANKLTRHLLLTLLAVSRELSLAGPRQCFLPMSGFFRERFMIRNCVLVSLLFLLAWSASLRADIVTDWNITLNEAIIATPEKHNPGTSTRAQAMMNAVIYDVFQAKQRTHRPFKYNTLAPDVNLDAAVAQAAYEVILATFGEYQPTLDGVLAARLGAIPPSQAKDDGIALGSTVAQYYINLHNDPQAAAGHDGPYTPTDAPGHWSSDPMVLPTVQKAWGSDWYDVTTWAMPNPDYFDSLIDRPAFNSAEYEYAFAQVKAYGERVSAVRSTEQTEIGLFWAYDRPNLPGQPGVGPPPVLFIENLIEIGEQVGNTPRDNARLFAMASVAQADAAIAAWDVKYEEDFWRPITAIRADAAHDDDNPNTVEDPNWAYLGAPGFDPNSASDDFTPPFPAYTSGHATMGGAIFKALERFYNTNDFSVADSQFFADADGVTAEYELTSNEYAPDGSLGMSRMYRRFTQDTMIDENGDSILDIFDVGQENSPEGENAMSRIYLGIHWLFDQQDGVALGNAIANLVADRYFYSVPEPSAPVLGMMAALGLGGFRRRQ